LYSGYTKNTYQYEGEKANIMNPDDSIKINELVKREGDLVDEYVKPKQWKPLIKFFGNFYVIRYTNANQKLS